MCLCPYCSALPRPTVWRIDQDGFKLPALKLPGAQMLHTTLNVD